MLADVFKSINDHHNYRWRLCSCSDVFEVAHELRCMISSAEVCFYICHKNCCFVDVILKVTKVRMEVTQVWTQLSNLTTRAVFYRSCSKKEGGNIWQ